MPLTKGQKTLLAALIALAVVLTALFGVLITKAAREQDRLREEQSRLEEEDRTPLGELTTPAPIVGTNGYRLLADGKANGLNSFYFGDEALYGRGMSDLENTDNYNAPSYRKMLTDALRAKYSNGLRASVITLVQNNTLSLAASAFLQGSAQSGPYMLAVLVPSDATATAGADDHGEGYVFAQDLEACIRRMRTASPHCDILLAVPIGASPKTADAILTLGAHYGLVTVDLRPLTAEEPLLHTEGPDAGYPTVAGHTATAAAIKAAIDGAVSERFSSPEMPSPLYEINN